jgi:cytochrome c biogenesis protein CcmG/thiol:disulfide interchange protein DsbE
MRSRCRSATLWRAFKCTTLVVILAAYMRPGILLSKDPPKVELVLRDTKGQRVRLSNYRGKPVVLNFWATWCVPCSSEMPMLVQAEQDYRGRGVVFIAASLDDSKTSRLIPAFVAKYELEFPVWSGATGDDLDKLGMGEAVPATAFLDSEGHIVARVLGQMREVELKERLDWLTGPTKGPPPQTLVKHLPDK